MSRLSDKWNVFWEALTPEESKILKRAGILIPDMLMDIPVCMIDQLDGIEYQNLMNIIMALIKYINPKAKKFPKADIETLNMLLDLGEISATPELPQSEYSYLRNHITAYFYKQKYDILEYAKMPFRKIVRFPGVTAQVASIILDSVQCNYSFATDNPDSIDDELYDEDPEELQRYWNWMHGYR